MKKTVLIFFLIIVTFSIGIIIENKFDITQLIHQLKIDIDFNNFNMTEKMTDTETMTDEKEILYWVAPMDPNYRRNEPGKSPMGMDLVPVYKESDEVMSNGMPIVKIRPEIVNNLGVRTTKVKRGSLWKKIGTVGYIDYDETRINHIHTRTEGWIEKLNVRAEGQQVKSGQLLFELYSPPMVNAQEEFLQALAIDNKPLSEASREKLAALGISKSQIERLQKEKKVDQYIRFYAPQSGVLINLGVREGMYIKPETQVLSLANLDSIWLLAEVFERQADWVKVGQIAEAELPSLPGVIWKGTVEYIYPDLDPITRTLRVRMRFDNPDQKLMPNMFAHVSIYGGEKPDVLSVPREALIRGADKERVILSLGDGRFQARDVVAGIESGDWIEIISGLDEGDEIVVSSQFLIDSESSLKASLHRMQPVEVQTHHH